MHGKGVISIWFFIGALLSIYGILILGSGMYELGHPPAHTVVLANLHAAIWWGTLMLVMGGGYAIQFWPEKSKSQKLKGKSQK
jgi:hypothetical protein